MEYNDRVEVLLKELKSKTNSYFYYSDNLALMLAKIVAKEYVKRNVVLKQCIDKVYRIIDSIIEKSTLTAQKIIQSLSRTYKVKYFRMRQTLKFIRRNLELLICLDLKTPANEFKYNLKDISNQFVNLIVLDQKLYNRHIFENEYLTMEDRCRYQPMEFAMTMNLVVDLLLETVSDLVSVNMSDLITRYLELYTEAIEYPKCFYEIDENKNLDFRSSSKKSEQFYLEMIASNDYDEKYIRKKHVVKFDETLRDIALHYYDTEEAAWLIAILNINCNRLEVDDFKSWTVSLMNYKPELELPYLYEVIKCRNCEEKNYYYDKNLFPAENYLFEY